MRIIAACVLLLMLALPAAAQPYESPMREECTAELNQDAKWMATLRAQVEDDLAYEWHDRNSSYFATNKKHVLIAYGALWVFVAGFAVYMFLRQRGLVDEIERLRAEVARAAED